MDISALAFHSIIIGLSILLSAVCLATVEHDAPFGLRVGYLECEVVGEPIVRTDFEHFQPRSVIFFMPESNERNAFEKARKRLPKTDYWILRRPAWTDALLNVVGKPPDIIYDPQLTQVCDIYLGIRAVTPAMSFGIKLSSDDDFTIVTAPAAMPNYHYDLEFFWRARVPMRGERIIVRAIGKPVYLQYFKFVPYLRRKLRKWFATKHIVVCRQPGKHLAFPGVAQLPNGDICVVFREGIAHVCPYGRIMLTRSHDGGRTWEAPVCIYDSPSDDRDPAIVVLRDGRIAVTLNTWNSWMADPALRRKYAKETKRIIRDGERKYVGAKIIFSNDGGETWSDAYLTPVFNPHGIAIAPDGKLYYVGVKTSHGWRHVVIYRSSNGIEWERYVEVARFPTASKLLTEVSTFAGYFCEPYLCIMPNGRWIVTLREHMHGFIWQVYSDNAGRTWSPPQRLNIRGYPQHLLPLRDGRLLMTYGYRYQPLGIRACLSNDAGATWDVESEIVLRHEGGHSDLGYPCSIQLNDERILTVYYYNHRGGDCYIEAAIYEPPIDSERLRGEN